MDSRLYFVVGDLVSNLLVGLIVGLVCAWLIPAGGFMFVAMVVAMLIGMVLGMLVWFPLSIYFGAMEVMVSTMFSGMLSGMVVGMWAAMVPLSAGQAGAVGLLCGLVGITVIWALNTALRGPRDVGAPPPANRGGGG